MVAPLSHRLRQLLPENGCISAACVDGTQPLAWCCERNDDAAVAVAAELLDRGADINAHEVCGGVFL